MIPKMHTVDPMQLARGVGWYFILGERAAIKLPPGLSSSLASVFSKVSCFSFTSWRRETGWVVLKAPKALHVPPFKPKNEDWIV